MHPYTHSSAIHYSQDLETAYMFINRWIDKEYVVHTYNGLLTIRKNKSKTRPFAATRMQLETLRLSELSQEERKVSYHSYMETNIWHK